MNFRQLRVQHSASSPLAFPGAKRLPSPPPNALHPQPGRASRAPHYNNTINICMTEFMRVFSDTGVCTPYVPPPHRPPPIPTTLIQTHPCARSPTFWISVLPSPHPLLPQPATPHQPSSTCLAKHPIKFHCLGKKREKHNVF